MVNGALRVVPFIRVPGHDVHVADVNRLQLAIQSVGCYGSLGLLEVCKEHRDRLFHCD